jgi:uncharacterized protein YdbL (DUF1318 family)
MDQINSTSTTSSAALSFPMSLQFIAAEKAPDSLTSGLRVATKAAKKGEKADFAPYVCALPALESIEDPIIRAAIAAGLYVVLQKVTEQDAARTLFKAAGHSGEPVMLEVGEVEFSKVSADLLSLERATGKKYSAEDIKAQVRALRDGFYQMVADKQGCTVAAIPDAIVKKLQARLMQLELWFAQFASPNFRPSTPDEAERFITALDQIGSAAQKLDVEAGEVFPVIQRRITSYLEAVAAMPDAEEEALF